MSGKMPSGNQAGVYASTLAYLNAVAATGSDDAKDAVPVPPIRRFGRWRMVPGKGRWNETTQTQISLIRIRYIMEYFIYNWISYLRE